MKLLEVTIRRAQLKEEYEDKIKEMFEGSEEIPTDENGKTAEWYEDLGIPVPDNLTIKETQNILPITDEYFIFEERASFIPLNKIEYIAGEMEEGCEIILSNGDTIKALEDEFEVYLLINELTRQTFWQKLKQLFK